MQSRWSLLALLVWLSVASAASAQFKEGTENRKGPRLGPPATQRWLAGLIVTAEGGACRNLLGTAPIPIDWPEQEVRVAEEEISPTAHVSYQKLEGSVKMMVVKIPTLPGGQQAKALVTLEIKRSTLLPPKDPSIYKLPDVKKLPREVRPWLGPSPLIECSNPRLKSLAKQTVADKEQAWEKVQAIYQWVRKNVQQKGGPLKGAVATIKSGEGNHEDMASVFIALCRAAGIPARTVWVPKHCYPEFYLVDDEGDGQWFPCQVAGNEEFGGISETGPVLAKGDNFRAAQGSRDKEKQRFPAESLTGEGAGPKREFVRKLLQ